MKIIGFPVGPLQANAYLAVCPATGTCAVIDPGAEAERLLAAAAEEDAEIRTILLTHAHLDHVGGVAGVHGATGAPIHLHPEDRPLYESAHHQAASFGLTLEEQPTPQIELSDGQVLEVGEESLQVRHTPGHSPGHVILVGSGFAFVGDCVFAGSIGRTDLPGGDAETLLRSIRERILDLPDDTVLYTGHGPRTTVGQERRANPFLTGVYGWSG